MPPKGSTRARPACEGPKPAGRQRKKQSTTARPAEPAAVPTPEKQQDFLQISKTGGVKPNRVEPATRSSTRQIQPGPTASAQPQPNPPAQQNRITINQQAPPQPAKKPLRTPFVNIEGTLKLDGAWNLRCYEYKYVTEFLQLHRFPTDSTSTSKERSPEDSEKTESNQIVVRGGFLTKKPAAGEPAASGSGGGSGVASHARDDEAGVLAGFVVEQEVAATEVDAGGQPDGVLGEAESEDSDEYVVKTAGAKPSGGGRLSRLQVIAAPEATTQESTSKAVEEPDGDVEVDPQDSDVAVKVEDEAEEEDDEGGSIASARTGAVQPPTPEEESREGSPEDDMSQPDVSVKKESMEHDESEEDSAVESMPPPPRPRAQQTSSTQAEEPQRKRDPTFSKMLQGAFGSGHPLKKTQSSDQAKNISPQKRKHSTIDTAETENADRTEVSESNIHMSVFDWAFSKGLGRPEETPWNTTAGFEAEEKEDTEESAEESPAVSSKKLRKSGGASRGRGGQGRGKGTARAK